eukprot:TRINITY_DN1991_c0_g2_i2.p1 TRINITY_DN1991_c0_g2~~TRINITY_DN1991_c0_g2_i2.p1  ORF type:complete len:312 (+),score=93.02 TRINITY_DN1991_c0_g2_i2:216-1151(+)
MFDLIIGTSTGGILTACFGLRLLSAEEVLQTFKELSKDVFSSVPKQKPHKKKKKPKKPKKPDEKEPTKWDEVKQQFSNFYKTGGRYDTENYEMMLRQAMGEELLIDSSKRVGVPKIAMVTTMLSVTPPQPFVLRNYQFPEKESRYEGTCLLKAWEAVRATSAAPSMFAEFNDHGLRLSDGGLVANNPTSVAFHEAKHIWPELLGGEQAVSNIAAIVSLGTGRAPTSQSQTGFLNTIATLASTVAETSTVDMTLQDFLPRNKYYRFSPVHHALGCLLDETRAEKIQEMQAATKEFIDNNDERLEELAQVLRD